MKLLAAIAAIFLFSVVTANASQTEYSTITTCGEYTLKSNNLHTFYAIEYKGLLYGAITSDSQSGVEWQVDYNYEALVPVGKLKITDVTQWFPYYDRVDWSETSATLTTDKDTVEISCQ